jgi:4-carboxymuconolactone decarboxylase
MTSDAGPVDERDARGAATFEEVMAQPAPAPDTVLSAIGVRQFVFGEVWNRGGLTRKERRLVTLAAVAETSQETELDAHVYGALRSGDLTIDELQEVVLHFAVYSGWPKAARVDRAMTEQWRRVQHEDGITATGAPAPWRPEAAFDAGARDERGAVVFEEVMTFPPPQPNTPYTDVGVRGFVFGEMWDRPGLTRKERRFITLACVCAADAATPVESHVFAALNSGEVSVDEAHEVGLQCAVYSGWPKASFFESVVLAQWRKITAAGGPQG